MFRRYNFVMFSTFHTIEDHLVWQEAYDTKFANVIKSIKNYYLSPNMTFSINYFYVALKLIDDWIEKVQKEVEEETE